MASGSLNFNAPKKQGTEKFTDNWQVSPAVMATAPEIRNPGCSTRSPAFTDTVHMSGTTTVTVKLALNKPAANLSVYLVTLPYDSARIGTSGQVGMVTRGWADPQNYDSLTMAATTTRRRAASRSCPEVLHADLRSAARRPVHPARPQLGVMIFSSDIGFTLHPPGGKPITLERIMTPSCWPGGIAGSRAAD